LCAAIFASAGDGMYFAVATLELNAKKFFL
jgi:hypothetical protein